MIQILIFILFSSPLIAMQSPARKYDQTQTKALMAILNKADSSAVCNSHYRQTIQQAIVAGADPNICIEEGFFRGSTLLCNWLDMYEMPDNGQLIPILLENGADPNLWVSISPLYKACKKGYIAIARQLIAYKAQVNAKTIHGVSPLMAAVENRFLGIVQVLLEHGASGDIDFVDAWGKTPLSFARKNNLTDIVQLLEEYKNRK